MDKKPLVSVCIPTYNGAHLVHRAIQSCLDQTYEILEVIVVDDSSKDDTVKVVEEFQKKSDKVKLFVNKENLGAAGNFGETFRLANGFYVQHLGQDDWLDKNHIAEKVSVFDNHPDIAFVANCQAAYKLDNNKKVILRKRFCKKHGYHFSEEVFKKFYREPGLVGFFCMMRKEDVMEQYLIDIPNDFGYEKYYRKAMAIDNLLLLRILNLEKYNGRYFYTNKTNYCNLERLDNYSRNYGWISEKMVADWVKFAHIDRVGYEFFYRNQAPQYLFRYRNYMGYNTLANVLLRIIAQGSREGLRNALNIFFKDYSFMEKSAVLLCVIPHLFLRIAKRIARYLEETR